MNGHRGRHDGQGETGATLLETMVTVTIAALLLALGVPGFIDFTRDVRRDGQVGDIVVALNYARSEAIRRGLHVTACPSADAGQCNGDTRWETGWIVFVDANSNGAVDGGEAVLRSRQAAPDGLTLRGAKQRLTYQSNGFSPGYNDTLRVCDPRGTNSSRRVIISNAGRVRVKNTAAVCP